MDTDAIIFSVDQATRAQLEEHLAACAHAFVPPLHQKVDIGAYAQKIRDNAVTFEAWHQNRLTGLVAAYMNRTAGTGFAYITSVSTLDAYRGKGIASRLMEQCVAHARQTGFAELRLEVNAASPEAVALYEKFSFAVFEKKDDFYKMKLEIR